VSVFRELIQQSSTIPERLFAVLATVQPDADVSYHIRTGRNYMLKKTPYFLIFCLLLLPLSVFAGKQEFKFIGKTMGTIYHITVIADSKQAAGGLREKIDQKLEDINQSMSTYRPDSQISRFNALKKADEKFFITDDFMEVLLVSRTVYQLTDGAWDGTVNPLVSLWGFMSEKLPKKIPNKDEIDALFPHIGFDKIIIAGEGYILKKDAEITLDLASIAKGHGVDKVSELLLNEGFNNFIVEIGGEVYAAGKNKEGTPWRVGINMPDKKAPFDKVYKVITLSDMAMATSGDYRNLIEIDGRSYSHIIDPKTGYPVQNHVVSATIIAQTCTFADGLATAVMVMGPQKSLNLINRLKNVEGLIISRNPDGTLIDHYSHALAP
jgi:FAD:protein FMN transferase